MKPFVQAMCLVLASGATQALEPQLRRVHEVAAALSGGTLTQAVSDAIMDNLQQRLSNEGLDCCIEDIAAQLWSDPDDRWFAVELAADFVFQRSHVDAKQHKVMLKFAERLGFRREEVRLAVGHGSFFSPQSVAKPRDTEPRTQTLWARARSA